VNKLGKDTEEQNLFMNLNTGKVSLDGADLVRALLITHVAKEELSDSDSTDTKDIVRINERRVRIGLELDEISAWWNQSDVRIYFDWLNKIKAPSSESIEFNSEVYPIDLLYKLYLAKEGKEEIKLGDFEVKNYIELYRNIVILHRTIKDWYQDCEIYHFVKFIMIHIHTDIVFKTIWDLWKNAVSRKKFIEEIKDKVKGNINKDDNVEAIDNLKENWFENDGLFKILILCDIIQIVKSQNEKNKLPYLESQYFKQNSEDREHIFPQTPISKKDIEKPTNELKKKVEKYCEILKTIAIDVNTEDIDWADTTALSELKDKINEELKNKMPINSIGNICLLHKTPNRSYGNELYGRKRFVIIQQTKDGEHIRPHTLNCFDKGFDKKEKDTTMDKWTDDDIQANASYIKKQITDFFNIKEKGANNE
jgi:hypothetical protein